MKATKLAIGNLSQLLYDKFVINVSRYAKQMPDGNYCYIQAPLSKQSITKMLELEESILIYQELNGWLKWICIDLDIDRSILYKSDVRSSFDILKKCTANVRKFLNSRKVDHIIEFSGNRGFHVWILLDKPITKSLGYEIAHNIKTNSNAELPGIINIDLYPKTNKINPESKKIGLGVKLPLSKHKKSNLYSHFCDFNDNTTYNSLAIDTLTNEFIHDQVRAVSSLLENDTERLVSSLGIESTMLRNAQSGELPYIKSRTISFNESFNLDIVLNSLRNCPIIGRLLEDYPIRLSGQIKEIMVGLLCRLKSNEDSEFGKHLLYDFFSRLPEFDPVITKAKLSTLNYYPLSCSYLKHFYPKQCENCGFVSPVQHISGVRLSDSPNDIASIDGGTFLKIRNAEHVYSVINDETNLLHSQYHIQSLSFTEFQKALEFVIQNGNPIKTHYYTFTRKETNKNRLLSNIDPLNRVVSTACIWILNKMFYKLNLESVYSYRVAPSFYNGSIFEPWTHQWRKYSKDIQDIVSNEYYDDYTVIKIDIRKFYDSIDLQKLKIMLMDQNTGYLETIVNDLEPDIHRHYIHIISYLLRLVEDYQDLGHTGLPQGPAFARYLTEIYLNDFDNYMHSLALSSEGYYFRYVDDIYLIVPTERDTPSLMVTIRNILLRKALTINEEKSQVCLVKEYRIQKGLENHEREAHYIIKNAPNIRSYIPRDELQRFITAIYSLIDIEDINQPKLGVLYMNEIDDIFYQSEREKYESIILQSDTYRGSLYKAFFKYYFKTYGIQGLDKIQNYRIEGLAMTELLNKLLEMAVLDESRDIIYDTTCDLFKDGCRNAEDAELSLCICFVTGKDIIPNTLSYLSHEMIQRIFSSNLELNPSVNSISVIRKLIEQAPSFDSFIDALSPVILGSTLELSTLKDIASYYFDRTDSFIRSIEQYNLANNTQLNIIEMLQINSTNDYTLSNQFSQQFSQRLYCLNSIMSVCLDLSDQTRSKEEIYKRVWLDICKLAKVGDAQWIERVDKYLSSKADFIKWVSKAVIQTLIFNIRGSQMRESCNELYVCFMKDLFILVCGQADDVKSDLQSHLSASEDEVVKSSTLLHWLVNEQVSLYPDHSCIYHYTRNGILVLQDNSTLEMLFAVESEDSKIDFNYLEISPIIDPFIPDLLLYKLSNKPQVTQISEFLNKDASDKVFLKSMQKLYNDLEAFRDTYLREISRYPIYFSSDAVFVQHENKFYPLIPYYSLSKYFVFRNRADVPNTEEAYHEEFSRLFSLKPVSCAAIKKLYQLDVSLRDILFGDMQWIKYKLRMNYISCFTGLLNIVDNVALDSLEDFEFLIIKNVIFIITYEKDIASDYVGFLEFIKGYLKIKTYSSVKLKADFTGAIFRLFKPMKQGLSNETLSDLYSNLLESVDCTLNKRTDNIVSKFIDQERSMLSDFLDRNFADHSVSHHDMMKYFFKISIKDMEKEFKELLRKTKLGLDLNEETINVLDLSLDTWDWVTITQSNLHIYNRINISEGLYYFNDNKRHWIINMYPEIKSLLEISSDVSAVIDHMIQTGDTGRRWGQHPNFKLLSNLVFSGTAKTKEALTNLSNHRCCDEESAKSILCDWLAMFNESSLSGTKFLNLYYTICPGERGKFFLTRLYEILIDIIAQHKSYSEENIIKFQRAIIDAQEQGYKLFHHQRIDHTGGSTRLLFIDDCITRIKKHIQIKSLKSLKQGDRLIILTDTIISGVQIKKAFDKYYVNQDPRKRKYDDSYYRVGIREAREIRKGLKSIERLKFVTIIGVRKGHEELKNYFSQFVNSDNIDFEPIINEDAGFYSDLRLDIKDKEIIEAFLTDQLMYQRIFNKTNPCKTGKNLNKMNIILRKNSLPKMHIKLFSEIPQSDVDPLFNDLRNE